MRRSRSEGQLALLERSASKNSRSTILSSPPMNVPFPLMAKSTLQVGNSIGCIATRLNPRGKLVEPIKRLAEKESMVKNPYEPLAAVSSRCLASSGFKVKGSVSTLLGGAGGDLVGGGGVASVAVDILDAGPACPGLGVVLALVA